MIKIFIPVSSKDAEPKYFCMDDYIQQDKEEYPIDILDEHLSIKDSYLLDNIDYHRVKYGRYSY